MEPSTSDDGNSSRGRQSGEKIAIAPRKENLVGGEPAPRLHLVPEEQVWERENRIRPKAPKIPFQDPLKTVVTPGPDPSVLPHIKSRAGHRFLHFFRSRRKGRYRVINFIVLPIAVLLTFFLIFCMIKFL